MAITIFSILHFRIYNLLTSTEDLKISLQPLATPDFFSAVILPLTVAFLSAMSRGLRSQVISGKRQLRRLGCVSLSRAGCGDPWGLALAFRREDLG